jgi:hypothetical protein
MVTIWTVHNFSFFRMGGVEMFVTMPHIVIVRLRCAETHRLQFSDELYAFRSQK